MCCGLGSNDSSSGAVQVASASVELEETLLIFFSWD